MLDTCASHDRVHPATDLNDAVRQGVEAWFGAPDTGNGTVIVTAATNDTVTALNTSIQAERLRRGDLDVTAGAATARSMAG